MNIGMVGLGRLGYPVAVAMSYAGNHRIIGYDVDGTKMQNRVIDYEAGFGGQRFESLVKQAQVEFGSLQAIVKNCDLIFVAVQTPHRPEFDGTHLMTEASADFDYTYLVDAIKALAGVAQEMEKSPIVGVISTVLPGTVRREILPVAGPLRIAYTPQFIAMGTTVTDFLVPEFVLIGADDKDAIHQLDYFYRSVIHGALQTIGVTIEDAEAIKVFYNTFIGLKIVFANTVMEMAHRQGGFNADRVMRALSLADRRLLSPAYLSGGMGDGGACHPRDNLALSWFSWQLGMKYNLFQEMMYFRERQAEWLCDLVEEQAKARRLNVCVLGLAYKRGVALSDGSSAKLCVNILANRGLSVQAFDPVIVPGLKLHTEQPMVYLVGVDHTEFAFQKFPPGSVVIDPWKIVQPQKGVDIIHVGRYNRV